MTLAIRNLTVGYGRKTVIQDLDADAVPGALTAIVGPNGSGKSTLIKAISGDLTFDGHITLNGTDVATAQPWHLAGLRGVLPQASTLAFPFHAIEVVRIGLSAGPDADHEHRAEAALARVGLAGYANRYYQELSGGEQQRVQLARVLAQVWSPGTADGPRWLMLDEPVSNLDIAHQLQVMTIARNFARAGGGVVAVMHDLNLTALFADHVLVMAEGQLLAAGHPIDVMTDEVLSHAYGCHLRVNTAPPDAVPYILPHCAAPHAAE
ncbi:heme ABC transporter ATP-binding protein [Tateyamaria omphalii]|uniref:Heme ABC transporter ATP-binding protein n=1 Tax=Tateyamaria omphalii TaxID=299262 RepID=A0A1P8N1F6_9RHOB|nr:heme ABC transporter ATP-binding protein [Tateyamaria omphalii]APX14078.1 heme ABC transporter ATP-binding protein [Tateyamaria omphalii]